MIGGLLVNSEINALVMRRSGTGALTNLTIAEPPFSESEILICFHILLRI